MALKKPSLFLYGFEVNQNNYAIDFQTTSGGPIYQASLTFGSYSSTALLQEVERAMSAVQTVNLFSWSIDRTTMGGTENRVSTTTDSSFYTLLFSTGPRAANSAATLLGFDTIDYAGDTTYTGSSTAGIVLITEREAYSYLPPTLMKTVMGALNITAGGNKEALVWQVQQFFQAEFKYEPEAKAITEWSDFLTWAIQQKDFEFTPEYTTPTDFIECNIETTAADGKGFGFKMEEMLPDFPFMYRTGMMKFRKKI